MLHARVSLWQPIQWIVEQLRYKETQEKKIAYKNLSQYRYCLMTNGTLNNPAPHQSCGCEIK